MDFSKFSDDNFEMKDWVNNALHIQKDTNVPIDVHTSNLVMKLQLFIQEVSKSLEETSLVALNNIPRVLREVENIKIETSLLKNQMAMVKDDIRKVEENTASSMNKLVEIDHVKVRMQDASNALQEADNWSVLSSQVEESFERNDLDQVAEKLIGMQHSLKVLREVPDYNERLKVLENHKNKLEALLSPTLVQIFNKHDLDHAKHYVQLFSDLDRLSQLQTYYNNCHKSSLMKTWKSVREDPNKTMVSWLPIFYDHLLALWYREISWCGQVFPDPVYALCVLISQTINSLQPSVGNCIRDALHDGEDCLDILIQLQLGTLRFVQGLEKAVGLFQSNSAERSVAVDQLISIVQAPYNSYFLQYSQLQLTTLMAVVDAINTDSLELSDCAESLSDFVGEAFKTADQALDSCVKFTSGYGSVGLVEALQIFFSAFFGCIDNVLSKLRRQYALDYDSNATISDDNDTTNQWTNFQYAFNIIEICGLLQIKTREFRRRSCDLLMTSLNQIMSDYKEQKHTARNYLKNKPAEWDKVVELYERMSTYDLQAILPVIEENVEKLNEHAHNFAFDIIFIHFKRQILAVPKMEIWCQTEQEAVDGELPTFSLSPLSYITHVGDSLLTLPQQLEPFFVQDNTNLLAALKTSKIPYQVGSEGAHYDHQWLECFARGAVTVYTNAILKIPALTSYSTRQLIADIDYFFNILAALEISSSKELQSIHSYLLCEPQKLVDEIESPEVDKNILKVVCKMRNICS